MNPFIVNGCQTSRTIWEVLHSRLEARRAGSRAEVEASRNWVAQGVVVTKVVKVGNEGEKVLEAITRYTNAQNVMRAKDFLALTSDFKIWARQMAERYGVYLEIQRGGWDLAAPCKNTIRICAS